MRPEDINKGIETIHGTIKLSKVGKHDFTIPNDPSNELWTNRSLHDMALYWGLPNVKDAQTCYFQEINFDNSQKDFLPYKTSIEEAIIENGKELGINYTFPYQKLYRAGSVLSAAFFYLFYLAA